MVVLASDTLVLLLLLLILDDVLRTGDRGNLKSRMLQVYYGTLPLSLFIQQSKVGFEKETAQ